MTSCHFVTALKMSLAAAVTALALWPAGGAALAQNTDTGPNGTVSIPGPARQTYQDNCTTTTGAQGDTITQCGAGNPTLLAAGDSAAAPPASTETSRAQDNLWVRFTEPREHAYTIDVPRGWQVSGGISRRSIMQPHSVLTLRSPGGATQMVLGNADAFTYSVLTPMSAQLGFREGMPYSPGADNLMVLNYRTGQQFAEMYGKRFLPQQCQNLQLVRARNRADAAKKPSTAYGLTYTSTAGDAFFTCEKDGHKLESYVFSETEQTGQPGVSAIWNADNTYLFLTPEGKGMNAGMVLAQIVKSVQIDPRWLANQLRVSADVANHALAEANAQLDANATLMQGTFSDTAKAAYANQEEMHRLLSGFDEYQTSTGEKKSVPYAAATNWWSNNKGQTLGTQGPLSPGMNSQEMKRVPPGQ